MNNAIISRFLLLAASLASCQFIRAQDANPSGDTGGVGYGIIGSSLARAEEAICRSVVNYNQVRGAFGEAVMERVALGSRRAGSWQGISVSPKPQGIDGLYIKHNSLGKPNGLLVGEAKFGTSRLAMTKDGRQLSTTWTSPRLASEAARYQQAGSASSKTPVQARPRDLMAKPDIVRVRLPDGRNSYFWRTALSDPWSYDGPSGTLESAKKVALQDSAYLKAAADGKISYRQRLYKIDVSPDTISVKVQNVKASSIHTFELKEIARVKIDTATRMTYMADVKTEIARQLLMKHPYLAEQDARALVSSSSRRVRHLEDILRQKNQPYYASVISDTGRAGMAGGSLSGVIDVSAQMYQKGQVDWGQTSGMVLAGIASTTAGLATHHLIVSASINNAMVNHYFVSVAHAVGLPTGTVTANMVGQGLGGAVGSIAFATIMFISGNMEGGDAARLGVAGSAGSIAGTAAYGGLMLLATTYGTAGTGAAISTLSGAAANSAAVAWLGGGTAAAGGGGMALGGIVMTGGVLVIAVATTAIFVEGYECYDEKQTNRKCQYTAETLLTAPGLVTRLCEKWN
jgi:hypothetical protein